MFLRAVGDGALSHPGDEVLVHHMAGDPAPVGFADGTGPGGDGVLLERLHLVWHAREGPGDRQDGLVVDRGAPFEVVAEEEAGGPQRHPADAPEVALLVGVLADALVNQAVVELLEIDLQVPWAIGAGLACETDAPVGVHPFEVDGVDGILLGLQPVAGHLGEDDLDEAVLPAERLPVRQAGRGIGAHVGPQEASERTHRIGLDGDLVPVAGLGIGDVVVGLLEAAPVRPEQPAMVVAAQAAGLDIAIAQVRAAVRAMAVDEAEGARQVLEQGEILAQEADRPRPRRLELAGGPDRVPIAAQVIAHRRARTHLGEPLIDSLTDHPGRFNGGRGLSRRTCP